MGDHESDSTRGGGEAFAARVCAHWAGQHPFWGWLGHGWLIRKRASPNPPLHIHPSRKRGEQVAVDRIESDPGLAEMMWIQDEDFDSMSACLDQWLRSDFMEAQ